MKDKILQAYNFRHATKEFDDTKKVSTEDMEFILETGRLSPSSFGFEPWHFVVVENKELKKKIWEISWGVEKSMMTCSHAVLIFARKGSELKQDGAYLQHIMRDVQQLPENVASEKGHWFGEFCLKDFKMDTEEKMLGWAKKQTYIALGNMLTSAAMIGIDSCPIEGFNIDKITELFKEENVIDTTKFELSCIALFGYRKADPKHPKTRGSKEKKISWIK